MAEYSLSDVCILDKLNADCLMHITSFLALETQAKLARCCQRMKLVCLTEKDFKDYATTTFPEIDYRAYYAKFNSWRATAKYLKDTVRPLQIVLFRVMPANYDHLSDPLLWTIFGDTYMDEVKAAVACYQQAYPGLLKAIEEGNDDLFWGHLFKVWQTGPKSDLWDQPLAQISRHYYPEHLKRRPDCLSTGFYLRRYVQKTISRQASYLIDQTLDILEKPRSLPSVRNLLQTILSIII